eukprot:scaffold128_cov328-Pavlova_lutheri.AAC.19
MMVMNSLPRWDISMTLIPLPCQLSISFWAVSRTSSKMAAGPAEKLYTRSVPVATALGTRVAATGLVWTVPRLVVHLNMRVCIVSRRLLRRVASLLSCDLLWTVGWLAAVGPGSQAIDSGSIALPPTSRSRSIPLSSRTPPPGTVPSRSSPQCCPSVPWTEGTLDRGRFGSIGPTPGILPSLPTPQSPPPTRSRSNPVGRKGQTSTDREIEGGGEEGD